MAPEFVPVLGLIGVAVLSLFGMIVGTVLLLSARRRGKRPIGSAAILGASFLLALFVYLCVPGIPMTATELCGNYVLDCDRAHEQLILNRDGTFSQTVLLKATGKELSFHGTWKYDRRSWFECRVSLDGLLSALELYNEHPVDYSQEKRGVVIMPAAYSFGELQLGIASDGWPQRKKVDGRGIYGTH